MQESETGCATDRGACIWEDLKKSKRRRKNLIRVEEFGPVNPMPGVVCQTPVSGRGFFLCHFLSTIFLCDIDFVSSVTFRKKMPSMLFSMYSVY